MGQLGTTARKSGQKRAKYGRPAMVPPKLMIITRLMVNESLNLTGQLLLAMPGLADTRFRNAVVFVCKHDADGAMGLIVNSPMDDLSLADIAERLKLRQSASAEACAVHYGGPVETQRGFVLHSTDYGTADHTMRVNDDFAVTASVEILEDIIEDTGPEIVLLALGYSGWGPGQLEEELALNCWLTVDAADGFFFAGDNATGKWTAALRAAGIEPVNLSGAFGRA